MATQRLVVSEHAWAGVVVRAVYDDVTLLVSAIEVTNPAARTATVTVVSPVGNLFPMSAPATAPGVYTSTPVPGGITLSGNKFPSGWTVTTSVS